MTTLTLKEPDRYLLNKGFTLQREIDVAPTEYRAIYQMGRLKKPDISGITLTLHDYGDGSWTYQDFAYSVDRKDEADEVARNLGSLPGYEAHQV